MKMTFLDRNKILKLLQLMMLLLTVIINGSVEQIYAQLSQKAIVASTNFCESNSSYLDAIKSEIQEDTSLIAVARLGDGEKSEKYNQQRLQVIKKYYHNTSYSKILVTVQGERVKGKGRIEIYVNGILRLIFEIPQKQNLKAGNCD